MACSDEQLGPGSDAPATCPGASKIGTVSGTTPVFDDPLDGSIYVGQQQSSDPASGKMFRVFLMLRSAERGLLIKLTGRSRPIRRRDGSR